MRLDDSIQQPRDESLPACTEVALFVSGELLVNVLLNGERHEHSWRRLQEGRCLVRPPHPPRPTLSRVIRLADRKIAVALLKKRIAEVVEGRIVGPQAERVTFDDLAKLIEADYTRNGRKSTVDMLGRVAHLRAAFGAHRAIDITHKMLLAYVEKRTREGAQPATIRYELVVFGRMYTLAIRAGMLTTRPPLPTIRLRNARSGFFEVEELARVLALLPADIAPAIEFASITGWRIGEIRGLTWAQVDVRACVVRLEPGTTKNDEGRTFPFGAHPRLGALMVTQLERALAIQERGKIIRHIFHRDGVPLGDFRKVWKDACKAAGCPDRLVHDLRRTAVRNLVRAGVSERVAMQLTGHRTRSVFDRYDIVTEADLMQAVEKLSRREA